MILLLDGTSDSRELALELKAAGYSIIVTATTEDGIKKLENINISVIKGKLNYGSLLSKCQELSITAIIDGTHPYADAMHENAIKVSHDLGIPLIRFERENIKISHDKVIYADNYEDAVNIAGKIGKNIFVTTGIRNIVYYKKLIIEHNVYFRVLPDPEGIKSLIDLGVEKSNIIAMEGNFSENLNLSIMKYYQIDTLITKDSGFNSEPKIMAALSLGINVIVIARKNHEWENVCNTTLEIKKILSNYRIK